VEGCKLDGESTAKLKVRTSYVTDTASLPPDLGAIFLVFLTKGLMEGLTREAERV